MCQKKPYSGLENHRGIRYWGRRSTERRFWGGGLSYRDAISRNVTQEEWQCAIWTLFTCKLFNFYKVGISQSNIIIIL